MHLWLHASGPVEWARVDSKHLTRYRMQMFATLSSWGSGDSLPPKSHNPQWVVTSKKQFDNAIFQAQKRIDSFDASAINSYTVFNGVTSNARESARADEQRAAEASSRYRAGP